MRRVAAFVLASVLLVPAPAWAGPDEVANSVSQKVMSPFCPGLTLHDCPSEAAADLRQDIATWAGQGMTEEEILDRLEGEFGEGILATPPADGAGLVAWLLPAFGLLAAVGIGLLLARKWTRPADDPAPAVGDANDRVRLEAELRQMREQA